MSAVHVRRTAHPVPQGGVSQIRDEVWSGTGSNRRPCAFQVNRAKRCADLRKRTSLTSGTALGGRCNVHANRVDMPGPLRDVARATSCPMVTRSPRPRSPTRPSASPAGRAACCRTSQKWPAARAHGAHRRAAARTHHAGRGKTGPARRAGPFPLGPGQDRRGHRTDYRWQDIMQQLVDTACAAAVYCLA
jgi:hypothetical protein